MTLIWTCSCGQITNAQKGLKKVNTSNYFSFYGVGLFSTKCNGSRNTCPLYTSCKDPVTLKNMKWKIFLFHITVILIWSTGEKWVIINIVIIFEKWDKFPNPLSCILLHELGPKSFTLLIHFILECSPLTLATLTHKHGRVLLSGCKMYTKGI